jgi:cytidine deaminase
MTSIDWISLKKRATDAVGRSYSPYSGFPVGAAVRTSAGETYVGTNVESISFGMSLCAERLAIFNAVTQGVLPSPKALEDATFIEAVVAVDASGKVLSPCGACRQVIIEFGKQAAVCLPHSVQPITAALEQPFDKLELVGSLAFPQSQDETSPALMRLFSMTVEDRLFLMRLQLTLREEVAQQQPEIKFENTRSVLFVRDGDYLVVAPGFFSNLDNPDERMLRIPLKRGISGAAYVAKSATYGFPGASAQGRPGADALPASEQGKVDSDLKWVVAWPLGEFGAVSLDGRDGIDVSVMRDISKSDSIQKRINQMNDLLNEVEDE